MFGFVTIYYTGGFALFSISSTTFDHISTNWAESPDSRQYAEIYTNESTIGIRNSGTVDVIMDLPVIGAPLRGFASFLGANPYTDVKQIESDLDQRKYDRKSELEGDQLAAMLFAGTALTTAEQMAAQGGAGFLNYIGSLININPNNISSINDLIGTTSNIMDIANSISGYLDQGNIQIDGADGFESFKDMVISAEGFKDIKGYSILQDKKIMNTMEDAGIPYEVDNTFGGDSFLENKAANELINNFNFTSGLCQMGVTDPNTINELYYQGIAYPVTTSSGQTLWINTPGFAEANKGLISSYTDNKQYNRYQKELDRMSDFNFMRSQYNNGSVDLSTKFMQNKDDIYKVMMDDGENYKLDDYFWEKFYSYEYGIFN